MKISSFETMLSDSDGSMLFDVTLPSNGEELKCKPMTLGQRKTLSKSVMGKGEDGDTTFKQAAVAVIKALSVEGTFNELESKYLDFVSALSQIMEFTIMEPLNMNIKCPKCEDQFQFEIQFEQFYKKIAELDFKPFTVTCTDKAKRVFAFDIDSPTIQTNIELEEFFKKSKKGEKGLVDFTFLYIVACIQNISLGDQNVEGFAELAFNEKIDLLDKLPSGIIIGGDNSVVSKTMSSDIVKGLNVISSDIKCPFCKHSMEGAITFDSFFIL
jgi:hypothetical protein